MTFRYYLQTTGPKPSLRRYGADTAERWDGQHWVPECAPEQACIATHDQRITEAQADKYIAST